MREQTKVLGLSKDRLGLMVHSTKNIKVTWHVHSREMTRHQREIHKRLLLEEGQ